MEILCNSLSTPRNLKENIPTLRIEISSYLFKHSSFLSPMSQNLAQAHKKLLEPVFNAATNRTPKPFAIEDLPKAIDDPIWNKIEEVYQLDLQELSALKNSVYGEY